MVTNQYQAKEFPHKVPSRTTAVYVCDSESRQDRAMAPRLAGVDQLGIDLESTTNADVECNPTCTPTCHGARQ